MLSGVEVFYFYAKSSLSELPTSTPLSMQHLKYFNKVYALT